MRWATCIKAFACSVPYLRLWGIVAGGWQMARAAQIAADEDRSRRFRSGIYSAKLATAAFYATHVLSQADLAGSRDHGRFG